MYDYNIRLLNNNNNNNNNTGDKQILMFSLLSHWLNAEQGTRITVYATHCDVEKLCIFRIYQVMSQLRSEFRRLLYSTGFSHLQITHLYLSML